MFKGLQDTSRSPMFRGFPNLNFQMNNEAYGFSGCTFWLDAAYGLNTQTNGANISSWVDRIRGNAYIQSVAGDQPVLISSDANFNNLPAINFTGNNSLVSGQTITTSYSTIAAVVRKTADAAGTIHKNALFWDAINANTQLVLRGRSNDMGIGIRRNDASLLDSGVDDTNPHIIIFAVSPTAGRIIIDGADVVSGSFSNGSMNFNQLSATGNSNRGEYVLAEMFLLNQELSSVDCIRLSDNINSKYAIY